MPTHGQTLSAILGRRTIYAYHQSLSEGEDLVLFRDSTIDAS